MTRQIITLCLTFFFVLAMSARPKTDITIADKDSIQLSYTANEIVIQSFKRNDNISQLPVSASLLSNMTIKERNIGNMKEITSFIPNLFMPDYGSKMTSPIYIRGIGSRIDAPSVGLYVDGVPYFDRSTFDLNLNDVDRIEVLKGPQGTIYGRNTMGGIINVYTKSPFKYKETNVNLSAGNYNTYKVGASHYNNVNNVFGYAASAQYIHTGGFFNNIHTGKKADPMDSFSGRIRLSWTILPQMYIHLTSAYEYSDQNGYPYGKYNITNQSIANVNYDAPSFYRRNISTNGLHVQYSTDKLLFNSQTSYQYFNGKQAIDQDFTPNDLLFVDFRHKQNMVSQEFNLKSLGNQRYEWLFGAFGFYQDFATNNDIQIHDEQLKMVMRSSDHTFQNIQTPSRGIALFHQSVINDLFVNNLSATLGLRYDWEEDRTHIVIDNQNIGQSIIHTDNKRKKAVFSQLSPKAALKYTFTNDEIVYTSVTRGYKTGGFNNTTPNEAAIYYKPEHSWSYEIGAKASCFDKLIYTDISLFYIDWKDQQISLYEMGSHGYIIRNAGRSTSKGFEIAMHINPIENFSIDLGYGYTHAKFNRYQYNDSTNYSGNFLPMVPRNTFSVAASYSINLQNNNLFDRITFNSQYKGAGPIYWREDNVARQKFYGTWDAKVSFEKGKLSVDLWTKNIASTKYTAYFFKSMLSDYAQRGKPFTCGVNVNLKF